MCDMDFIRGAGKQNLGKCKRNGDANGRGHHTNFFGTRFGPSDP